MGKRNTTVRLVLVLLLALFLGLLSYAPSPPAAAAPPAQDATCYVIHVLYLDQNGEMQEYLNEDICDHDLALAWMQSVAVSGLWADAELQYRVLIPPARLVVLKLIPWVGLGGPGNKSK